MWLLGTAGGCRHSPDYGMNAKRHTVASAETVASGGASERIVTIHNPDIAPIWTGPAMVDGEPERVSLAGGWVATIRPRRARAVPGAELIFALELRPTISGSGQPVLLTKGPRIQLRKGSGDLNSEGRLPEHGGTVYASLVVAPDEWAPRDSLAVAFERRDRPKSVGYLELPTPVTRADTSGLVQVGMESRTDGCKLPSGLSAEVRGREVTVTYSTGVLPLPTSIPFAMGYIRRNKGRFTFVGFVREEISDVKVHPSEPHESSCQGQKAQWASAVSVSVPVGSGPMDVVVFSANGNRIERQITAVLVN